MNGSGVEGNIVAEEQYSLEAQTVQQGHEVCIVDILQYYCYALLQGLRHLTDKLKTGEIFIFVLFNSNGVATTIHSDSCSQQSTIAAASIYEYCLLTVPCKAKNIGKRRW